MGLQHPDHQFESGCRLEKEKCFHPYITDESIFSIYMEGTSYGSAREYRSPSMLNLFLRLCLPGEQEQKNEKQANN